MSYIYLLQTREAIRTNDSVYKIGKTKQDGFGRFNNYPKGSQMICHVLCNNCDKLETQLKELFAKKYKKAPLYGSEYFEGDSNEMFNDIIKAVNNEKTVNNEKNRKKEKISKETIVKETVIEKTSENKTQKQPNKQNKNKPKNSKTPRTYKTHQSNHKHNANKQNQTL